MLHYGIVVGHVDIRERVCAAFVAKQQRVARGIVAGIGGLAAHLHQSAVRVLAVPCRDAFRDDGGARVLAEVNHLRARVGLLVMVRHGHAVKFCLRVVARKDARGIFPCNGGAGFHLRPREFRAPAAQMSALCHEVVHAAASLLIAGIPVLHRGIFYLCIFHHDNFHYGGVQLVLVAHRCGAAFEITHVRPVVAHDERALKLPRLAGVDAEIGGKFHGAAHALGDIHEGTVGKYGGIERGEIIVAVGHHRAEVLAHQVGILAHGLADRTKDDAFLLQRLLESGLHRYGVHHGIYCHACQSHAFFKGNTEFVERLHQFGVDFLFPVLVL